MVLAVALAPGAVNAQAPHPTLRVGDALRLDVRLKLQADLDGSAEKGEANRGETFSLHRRRVGIQGRLFTRVRFEIRPDGSKVRVAARGGKVLGEVSGPTKKK